MRMRLLFLVLFALAVFAPATYAQGGVKNGPDPSTITDPDLERDSQHNYEVARNYFKLKKAYVAALKRCEEIIAGNPSFKKIDEVLLMAGQSSRWLAESKGKQRPDLYVTFDNGEKRTLTAEQFREMARHYLTQLVTEYPSSSYAKQAQEELSSLQPPKQ